MIFASLPQKYLPHLTNYLSEPVGPVNGFFSNSNIEAGQLEIFRENIFKWYSYKFY